MIDFLIIVGIVLFLSMTIGATIGVLIRNTGLVDIFWGLNIVAVSVVLYVLLPSSPALNVFVLLISLWGVRLALFLFFTRILKGNHDRRYTEFEKKWGAFKTFRMFTHFYFQALIQFILCFSFYPFYSNTTKTLGLVQIIAIVIFIMALVCETIADLQLYKFKAIGKRGVFRGGLWAISRHPNLFFEWLVWVSLAIFSANYTGNVYAWVAPLSVWVIIRFMTGPYTERLSLEKYKEQFQKYKDEVPMIIPRIRRFKKER